MESKPKPVYEVLEVHTEWVHEAAVDTLIAYLPGFRTEQIKVQVTTGGNLRIFGERPIGGKKFSRFFKEFPIPSNCDQNNIKANFKDGMLRIKHPIVPADKKLEQAEPSAESDQKPAPQPPRPADEPQKQKNEVEEAPSRASTEKRTDGIAKEADKPMEKEKNGWDQEERTSTISEKLGDVFQDAAQKENIEPTKLHGTDKYQIAINMAWVKYKQFLDGLAKGIKNPRMMMNMVLAVLLVVILAVYLRNAIRSLGND